MATLEINNSSISFDSNKFLNIKSILPKLQKEYPARQYSVQTFRVNGQEIDFNSEAPQIIRPMNQNDVIHINFVEEPVKVDAIVNELPILLNKIINKILHSTTCLDDSNNLFFSKELSIAIDAVDVFIKSITFALDDVSKENDRLISLPINELKIHLLSVMKAINSARKSRDFIMLTDLLEYELKDNLTQWKIIVIPVLKNILKQKV